MFNLLKRLLIIAWYKLGKIFPLYLNNFFLFLAIILLISCLSALSSSLAIFLAPAGLLSSISNDLENAVNVASRTSFYNVNFFFDYGPLYYRIVDFMYQFSPNVHFIDGLDNLSAKKEISVHFYLTFIVGSTPYLIGFIIGIIIKANLTAKLILSSIIGTALLHTLGWSNELYRLHPEVLLSVCTAILPLLIFKSLNKPMVHSSSLNLGVLIGIAMSIKLSFITFLPTILLSKFTFKYKLFLKTIIFILIIGLIVYFFVGFPQNFISIISTIKFLLYQSSLSLPPNADSFILWIKILFADLKIVLPITIILSYLLSPNITKSLQLTADKKLYSILGLLFILPLIFLFLQNYVHISSSRHYALPYESFILSSSALLIFLFKNNLKSKYKLFTTKKIDWSVFFLLIFLYIFSPGIPHTINAASWSYHKARVKILEGSKLIQKYDNKNTTFLRTAYASKFSVTKKVHAISEENINKFLKINNDNKILFLLISSAWYSRFEKDKPNQWDISGMGLDEFNFQKEFFSDLFKNNYIKKVGTFRLLYSFKNNKESKEQYWVLTNRE